MPHYPLLPACPYHLNCVRGCLDYLRTKGSQSERQHLIQIQRATERALSSAKAYSARGNEEITEPWVRHCEETLAGVKKAVAVDDATGPMGRLLGPGVARPTEPIQKAHGLNNAPIKH